MAEIVESPSDCKYFGLDNSLLKMCRTCTIKEECYYARIDKLPIYAHTVAYRFVVDKEHEEELNNMIKKLEKYMRREVKKIKTCELHTDFGMDEDGYYETR